MNLVLPVLLFYCFVVSGQRALTAKGIGASFPAPIYQQWIFAFMQVSTNVTLTYDAEGSGAGQAAISSAVPAFDFAGSDARLADSAFDQFPDLQMFPTISGSVAVIANLGLNDSISVTLGRNTVTEIFAGNITQWNHPSILAENPGVQLPNQTIQVIVRKDRSGTTSIFTSALASFSSAWKSIFGEIAVWPSSITSNPNFIQSNGNIGCFSRVKDIPFSLTYVSEGELAGESLSGLTVVKLVNQNGIAVAPNDLFIEAAQKQASFDSRFFASIVDLPGDDTYPIIGFTYIIVRTGFNERCEERREMFKFFNWFLTVPEARSQAVSLGYTPLIAPLATQVLELLSTVQCKGKGLLDFAETSQHTNPYIVPVFTVNMIVIPVLVIAGLGGYCALGLIPRKKVLLFAGLAILSAFAASIGSIFWFLYPTSDTLCTLRQWFSTLPYVVLMGSLYSKIWYQYYFNDSAVVVVTRKFLRGSVLFFEEHPTDATSEEPKTVKSNLQNSMWLIFVFFLVLQFVLLIIWTATDPFKLGSVDDNINRTREFICTSTSFATWAGLEFGLLVLEMIWGFVIFYFAWGKQHSFTDIRWNLLLNYNLIVALIVLLVLVGTSSNGLEDTDAFIAQVLIVTTTTGTVMFSAIPAYIQRFAVFKFRKSLKEDAVELPVGLSRSSTINSNI